MRTTDRTDTATRVRTVLEKRFCGAAGSLTADAELVDGLPNFDSLAALEFITAVEEEFAIEVDFVGDDVRYCFSTLDRVVDYVTERVEDQV
jgi:acyl carrier protein